MTRGTKESGIRKKRAIADHLTTDDLATIAGGIPLEGNAGGKTGHAERASRKMGAYH